MHGQLGQVEKKGTLLRAHCSAFRRVFPPCVPVSSIRSLDESLVTATPSPHVLFCVRRAWQRVRLVSARR
ncbi:MAG: hypothetical protein ACOVO0_10645, partial [Burkholderiaceae bacterium]